MNNSALFLKNNNNKSEQKLPIYCKEETFAIGVTDVSIQIASILQIQLQIYLKNK